MPRRASSEPVGGHELACGAGGIPPQRPCGSGTFRGTSQHSGPPLAGEQASAGDEKGKQGSPRIHAFRPEQELILVAWCDASSQNRHDGGSTEGILVGMASQELRHGHVDKVSPMYWKSSRIDRVCRSPGAAEARAAVDAEDNLHLLRYAWAEFCGHQAPVHEPEALVSKICGVLVTDSRNVYDRVTKPYISPKGAQKKVDIELMAIKESQTLTGLEVRWVNSEAQLANSLTKRGEDHQITRFISLGQRWRIIHDPDMFSGKKRKAQGLGPLEQNLDCRE